MTVNEFRETASSILSNVALGFQFFCVFLLAPLVSAGLIAQEKRDRTLGLLLMADMRGADIAFAKLLSAFTQVEFLLLSTLPLVAVAAYLGGVDVPVVALQILLFSGLALATCSIGLLCSTVTSRPVEALVLAVVIEAVWMIGHRIVSEFWPACARTNPAAAIVGLDQDAMDVASWLPALVLCLLVAAVCCAAAIALLPHQVFERPLRARRRVARRNRLLRELLPASPESRLISASAPGLGVFSSPRYVQYLAALALVPFGFVSCCGVAPLLVVVIVCYDVTSSLATARESGALDSILVTPMDHRRLARSIFRAFFRRSALFYPAVAAPGVLILTAATGGVADAIPRLDRLPLPLLYSVLFVLLLPFLLTMAAAVLWSVTAYACHGATLPGKPATQTAITMGILIATQVMACSFAMLAVYIMCSGLELLAGIDEDDLSSSIGVVLILAYLAANIAIATASYLSYVQRLRRWRIDDAHAASGAGDRS